jgi:hypothetical protein
MSTYSKANYYKDYYSQTCIIEHPLKTPYIQKHSTKYQKVKTDIFRGKLKEKKEPLYGPEWLT